MAVDNYDPNNPGREVAGDEVDGVLIPRTKLVIGANNINDGDVSASNPMPVELNAQTIFGELSVAIDTAIAQFEFVYGVNTNYVDTAVTGSGAVTVANSIFSATTGPPDRAAPRSPRGSGSSTGAARAVRPASRSRSLRAWRATPRRPGSGPPRTDSFLGSMEPRSAWLEEKTGPPTGSRRTRGIRTGWTVLGTRTIRAACCSTRPS